MLSRSKHFTADELKVLCLSLSSRRRSIRQDGSPDVRVNKHCTGEQLVLSTLSYNFEASHTYTYTITVPTADRGCSSPFRITIATYREGKLIAKAH